MRGQRRVIVGQRRWNELWVRPPRDDFCLDATPQVVGAAVALDAQQDDKDQGCPEQRSQNTQSVALHSNRTCGQ